MTCQLGQHSWSVNTFTVQVPKQHDALHNNVNNSHKLNSNYEHSNELVLLSIALFVSFDNENINSRDVETESQLNINIDITFSLL